MEDRLFIPPGYAALTWTELLKDQAPRKAGLIRRDL
jgi:hypothetical protein